MAGKRQKQAALAALKRAIEPMSLSTLAASQRIPDRTLRRWLADWVAQGTIKRVGVGRATRYRYSSANISSFAFLADLDHDLKHALLKQLRDLWTHNSTALEGNTLSLGDTHFVLEEGLTISGKPLKDHQEIIGHARAIELLYAAVNEPVSETFLFELHKAIQTEQHNDIYKPIGDWKIETNGTYALTEEGTQTFIEYALPAHVPTLMSQLIDEINLINRKTLTHKNAYQYYAKIHMAIVHIHPFWDGNGRIARLIANLPILKAGLPPLVIPQTQRREYIQALARYQIEIGQLTPRTKIWPDIKQLDKFERFCESNYSATKELVENAFIVQANRKGK